MPTLTQPRLVGNPQAVEILNKSLESCPIPGHTGKWEHIILRDSERRSIGEVTYVRTYHGGNTNVFDVGATIHLYEGLNIALLEAQPLGDTGRVLFDDYGKVVRSVDIQPTKCTRVFTINFNELHTRQELTIQLR